MAAIEVPRPLSARYKEEFAYVTIKDRLPVIISKVVDTVYRSRDEVEQKYGEAGMEDMKFIVGQLSKLRNELQTDKVVLPLTDGRSDIATWQKAYKQEKAQLPEPDDEPTWFSAPWLYLECYMYRRIQEAISFSNHLKELDPFFQQKQAALTSSAPAMETLGGHLLTVVNATNTTDADHIQKQFRAFTRIALWGNKCDLSISAGEDNYQKLDPLAQVNDLNQFILVDDTDRVFTTLKNARTKKNKVRVDFVLDNAGFELFSDLCYADFLISTGLADSIQFHYKAMPWFVSDVTKEDFDWTLEQLINSASQSVHSLGKRWKQFISDKTWLANVDDFWTCPQDFSEMRSIAPHLYSYLAGADLIFFKGDLNYRKLARDRKWDTTTAFNVALCGFHPAPLCTLRTLKADIVVGLAEGVAAGLSETASNWMISGDYAVIQFSTERS